MLIYVGIHSCIIKKHFYSINWMVLFFSLDIAYSVSQLYMYNPNLLNVFYGFYKPLEQEAVKEWLEPLHVISSLKMRLAFQLEQTTSTHIRKDHSGIPHYSYTLWFLPTYSGLEAPTSTMICKVTGNTSKMICTVTCPQWNVRTRTTSDGYCHQLVSNTCIKMIQVSTIYVMFFMKKPFAIRNW